MPAQSSVCEMTVVWLNPTSSSLTMVGPKIRFHAPPMFQNGWSLSVVSTSGYGFWARESWYVAAE